MLSALHMIFYATSELPQHHGQGGDPPIRAGTTRAQVLHIPIPLREHMLEEGHPGEVLILMGIPVRILTV